MLSRASDTYECIHLCVYMPLRMYGTPALCLSYVTFQRSKRSTFRRSKRSTFRRSKRTPDLYTYIKQDLHTQTPSLIAHLFRIPSPSPARGVVKHQPPRVQRRRCLPSTCAQSHDQVAQRYPIEPQVVGRGPPNEAYVSSNLAGNAEIPKMERSI